MATAAIEEEATLRALEAMAVRYPLQYRFLIIWKDNPKATQAEIAALIGCCQQNVSKVRKSALRNFSRLKHKVQSQITGA